MSDLMILQVIEQLELAANRAPHETALNGILDALTGIKSLGAHEDTEAFDAAYRKVCDALAARYEQLGG